MFSENYNVYLRSLEEDDYNYNIIFIPLAARFQKTEAAYV